MVRPRPTVAQVPAIDPATGPDHPQAGAVIVTVMVFMAFLMLFGATFVNHVLTSESTAVEQSLADTRAYWAMNGQLNYMLSRAAYQGLCAAGVKTADQTNNAASDCSSGSPTSDDEGVTGSYPAYGGRDVNGTTTTRVGSLQDYLNGTGEIQASGTINAPGVTYWYYPQNTTTETEQFAPATPKAENLAQRYQFAVRGVVSERYTRDTGSGGTTSYDGQIRVDFEVLDADDGYNEGSAPAILDMKHRVGRLTFGLCVVDLKDAGATVTTDTEKCRGKTPDPMVEGAAAIQFIQRNYPLP